MECPLLVGYASIWGCLSGRIAAAAGDPEGFYWYQERIDRGAFAKSISNGEAITAVWDHDPSKQLASTLDGSLRLQEDDVGLAFELEPRGSDTWIAGALRELRSGRVCRMSFRFLPIEMDWQIEEVWSSPVFMYRRWIRIVREAELRHISPVLGTPAYSATSVRIVERDPDMVKLKLKRMRLELLALELGDVEEED